MKITGKITEQELNNMGRVPRKTRISFNDGKKYVHLFSDEEILELVKTGKATISEDAEWLEVIG